jgi:hypothetical protein
MTGAADAMMSFPVGTVFTPYSVLRNISGQSATLTPSLYWMAGGTARSAQLPPFQLAPGQSAQVAMASLLNQSGLKNFNGSVNLVLGVNAGLPSGALLMASGSVDQKDNYVFQVVPHAVLESVSKNLSYWSTRDGDDTMVTLWNPADENQDLVFTLTFAGGHYLFPVHLGPKATQMFNVSEIISNHMPDSQGNVIPLSVHEGAAVISGPQGESEHILVALDAGTYSVRKATCGTFCTTCEGVVSTWVAADPFSVNMGDTYQAAFAVQYHNGNQYDVTSSGTWNSSDTSIATVSAGMVSPVAAGSPTLNASQVSEPNYFYACGSSSFNCPVSQGSGAQSPGTVKAPYPTNFTLSAGSDTGSGTLHFGLTWASSTGTMGDLTLCTMGESVTYPLYSNPLTFPSPLPPISGVNNPTVNNFAATAGAADDDHLTPGTFGTPYSYIDFQATQIYRYACPGVSGGNWVTLGSSYTIDRKVTNQNNGNTVPWYFLITKNGYSATINPLP